MGHIFRIVFSPLIYNDINPAGWGAPAECYCVVRRYFVWRGWQKNYLVILHCFYLTAVDFYMFFVFLPARYSSALVSFQDKVCFK